MPDDRVLDFPKPTKMLSKAALAAAWDGSRDSTKNSGTPGVDGQSARSFAANLDHQLEILAGQLKRGQFGFGPLRPRLIHKADGVRYRLICVPSVRDRLVQRAIAENIIVAGKFGDSSPQSYGFVRGTGLKQAIAATIGLRSTYDYVFETDIESFFDRVDRADLKQRVKNALGRSSLVPLIINAVDCEIRSRDKAEEGRIAALGVKRGVGLRQGMPLSPLLANLALAKFDGVLEKQKIPFIRYADDVVTFARSREEAMAQASVVRETLASLKLSVPEISDNGKSRVCSKHQSFIFLGREFYFSQRRGDYLQRVPTRKIQAIVGEIAASVDIATLARERIGFGDLMGHLNRIAASYRFTYGDAANSAHLDSVIVEAVRNAKRSLFISLFGKGPVDRLTKEQRSFLQLDDGLDRVEEYDDFDEY